MQRRLHDPRRANAAVAGRNSVSVPAGLYTLNPALGALALNGDTLTGAGARATIIDGAQQTRESSRPR